MLSDGLRVLVEQKALRVAGKLKVSRQILKIFVFQDGVRVAGVSIK